MLIVLPMQGSELGASLTVNLEIEVTLEVQERCKWCIADDA